MLAFTLRERGRGMFHKPHLQQHCRSQTFHKNAWKTLFLTYSSRLLRLELKCLFKKAILSPPIKFCSPCQSWSVNRFFNKRYKSVVPPHLNDGKPLDRLELFLSPKHHLIFYDIIIVKPVEFSQTVSNMLSQACEMLLSWHALCGESLVIKMN